jgi:hypothetical protein
MSQRRFKNAAQRRAYPRRLRALLAKGWQRLGSYFVSPYTGHRYDEQAAFDIEMLRDGVHWAAWKNL